jgi:secondary thiamine-phosphate synthase enzyme
MDEWVITLKSSKRIELIPVTSKVRDLIHESGIQNGLLHLFVPHSTAGITINEQADHDVAVDIEDFFSHFIPKTVHFRHAEGNSAAHILSTLTGVCLLLPLQRGSLSLGQWQGLFFCEFDGPRNRRVCVRHLRMQ